MKRPALLFLAVACGCGLRLGGGPPSEPAGVPGPAGPPCTTPADCPAPREPCVVAACPAGSCTEEVAAAGVVPAAQVRGDCRELTCDGRGRALTREDPADPPADDDNVCTEERCAGDRAEHAPVAAGAPCGRNGVCNGAGRCGVCVPDRARCDGAALSVCDASGQWQPRPACQGATAVCSPFAPGGCTAVAGLALDAAITCATLADGSARCVGADPHGLLGAGGARVRLPAGAAEIALGRRHACVRLAGGAVRCWGDNGAAQLGDGTRAPRGHLVAVVGLADVAQIAAGGAHTCARLGSGGVTCWGANQHGQLGDGSVAAGASTVARHDHEAPRISGEVRVPGPFVSLALGGDRACARLASGAVECWGAGALPLQAAPPEAPLGKPPRASAAPPRRRPVSGLGRAVEIALGEASSCARLVDGTIACWGANDAGQLGDGGQADHRTAVRVLGVRKAAALVVGRAHGCALLGDGKVMCWGGTSRRRAEVVADLGEVVAIAAGGDRTCALSKDGAVRCGGAGREAPALVGW